MSLEELTQFEIIEGTLSLTYALLGIIIGFIVIFKYFNSKRKELLGVAFAIILSVAPWMAGGISFLTFIFFGFVIQLELYLFIAYGIILFANLCMIYAIISLLYPEYLKKTVFIYLIIAIAFDILLLYLLFTNVSLVGERSGKFDVEGASITSIVVLFVLATALAVRILFIKEFSKSESRILQWRGRFILVEASLMIIGGIMDGILQLTIATLIFVRILLVLRLLFLYLGWLLPNRVAKWLIKEAE